MSKILSVPFTTSKDEFELIYMASFTQEIGESDEEYQDIVLTDELFLNWIKAKILLNNTEGGKEDCISYFKLLLNDMTLPVKISIPAKASLDVELGRQLSLQDVSICIAYAKAIKPIGITMRLFDTVGEILLHDVDLIGDYFD